MSRAVSPRWIVVGRHPGHRGNTVAAGTFHSMDRAVKAADNLNRKGWLVDIVQLSTLGEIKEVL